LLSAVSLDFLDGFAVRVDHFFSDFLLIKSARYKKL